eukprot:6870677-Prymnesium_polylepis.1
MRRKRGRRPGEERSKAQPNSESRKRAEAAAEMQRAAREARASRGRRVEERWPTEVDEQPAACGTRNQKVTGTDSDKNRQGKVYGERSTLTGSGRGHLVAAASAGDAEREAEHNKATSGVSLTGGDGGVPLKTAHVAGALAGWRASRSCFLEGRKTVERWERREHWESENKSGREVERTLTRPLNRKLYCDTTRVPTSVRRMRENVSCTTSDYPPFLPGCHSG